jgi:hypothetical protein
MPTTERAASAILPREQVKCCCYCLLLLPVFFGCRQPELISDVGDAIITVKVHVLSYVADAAHSTISTPDGETYHADMYDAAYCQIASDEADLPDPFVIWGWNRTEYVPESLRMPEATATIAFPRSAIEDTPFGDGTRGIHSTAISELTN